MNVALDTKNKILNINSFRYNLEPVYNDRLLKAISDGSVIVDDNCETINERKELYYCARKVLCKTDCYSQNHYMDIIMYNEEMNTFIESYCNRSLGHKNDIHENEIHQVVQGKIGELILWENRKYWGIFSAGEYVEIPCGAYHCTYILEKNTIVANIYSNVFWEYNLKLKPYFSVINDISVIKEKDVFYLKNSKFNINIEDRKTLAENGFDDCKSITKKCYYTTQYDLSVSIFDLFAEICKKG